MKQQDPKAINITFLGTSSGVPTAQRNVTSIALSVNCHAEMWLLDCGEGTQRQLLKCPHLSIGKLRRIFITHVHGDHIYGLFGLLSTLNQAYEIETLDLYGPQALETILNDFLKTWRRELGYQLNFHVVKPGLVAEDSLYQVYCARLKHSIETYGYRIVEKDKIGAFDVAKAQKDGISPGPLYGQLKQGNSITLPDGRTVHGQDYIGESIKGRIIAYCSDTTYCDNAIQLAKDANCVIHEATYINEQQNLAKAYLHSTAKMAAQVAKAANAHQLLITHYSSRYLNRGPRSVAQLLHEARAVFPNTLAAKDFFKFDIFRQLNSKANKSRDAGLDPVSTPKY